ncbi:hypothetical protein L7F22_058881 [Adiantum nelumboides]|nr:hypothetical protein [Adiantum nelumboides]
MVIADACALEHKDVVELAGKLLDNLFTNPTTSCHFIEKDSTISTSSEILLGGRNKCARARKNMVSELAQKVAANELCESYKAFNTNYSDAGLYGVYAIAKPDKLDDLSWAIMHKIRRLIYRVTKDDAI